MRGGCFLFLQVSLQQLGQLGGTGVIEVVRVVEVAVGEKRVACEIHVLHGGMAMKQGLQHGVVPCHLARLLVGPKLTRQRRGDEQKLHPAARAIVHDAVQKCNIQRDQCGIGVCIVGGSLLPVVPVGRAGFKGVVRAPAQLVPTDAGRAVERLELFRQRIDGRALKAVVAEARMDVAVHVEPVADSVVTLAWHLLEVFIQGEVGVRKDDRAEPGHGIVLQQIVIVTVGLRHLRQREGCVGKQAGIHAIERVAAAEYQGAHAAGMLLHPLVFAARWVGQVLHIDFRRNERNEDAEGED